MFKTSHPERRTSVLCWVLQYSQVHKIHVVSVDLVAVYACNSNYSAHRKYSETIIVRGVLMFVDIVGYPYPEIYVSMNGIVLHCKATNQLPTKLHPHQPAIFWLSATFNPQLIRMILEFKHMSFDLYFQFLFLNCIKLIRLIDANSTSLNIDVKQLNSLCLSQREKGQNSPVYLMVTKNILSREKLNLWQSTYSN